MSGGAAAAVYGWFAVFYIGFIASGALPSELKPGRRSPPRVITDRLMFFGAVFAMPFLALRLIFRVDSVTLYLRPGAVADWLAVTLALSSLGFAVGLLARKSKADLSSYPQFFPGRWTVGAWALELGSWSLYLTAYEFAFRGYLLAALMPLGPVPAIAATTALYAIAHLPKSAKEAIGSLPFGAIASMLTVRYGSLIPAVAIHLAVALGNDCGAIMSSRRAESTS